MKKARELLQEGYFDVRICTPQGRVLLSEEFDVAERQMRGNLPQAFVHALLLECAVELSRLEQT